MSETVKGKGVTERILARYTAKTANAVIDASEAWQKVKPGSYGDTYVGTAGWVTTTEFLGRDTMKLMLPEPNVDVVSFAYASNPRRKTVLGVAVSGNKTDGYNLARYEAYRKLTFPNLISPWTLRRVRKAADQFRQRAGQFPQRRG